MRFAVSNIAWGYPERQAAYARLETAGITGLEIAPGLLFAESADPFVPSAAELAAAQAEIADAGLTLVSMQSLLFGVKGADLFGDEAGRAAFVTGLGRAIALAERLEIPNLVMGSPKQRNRPDGMSIDAAMDHAAEILRPLAAAAAAAGTKIAMECNPAEYGTNFLTMPEETLGFVHRADHPAITLNFDIGATHLTGTFPRIEDLLAEAGPAISHVHVSEPFLAPAPANPADAARVLRKLRAMGYANAVSIEMLQPEDGLAGLDMALQHLNAARDATERNL
jgi:sugar phosphate isomerase/epimerase